MHRNDFGKKQESFHLNRYGYVREKEKQVYHLEIFLAICKISVKESCLYGIIDIRITPFLDDGF